MSDTRRPDESENTAKRSPIAIVGMGCMFPKADGLEAYWANICQGIDAITEVPETHWPLEDYFSEDQKKPDFTYGRRGGFLSPFEFDPLKYGIPPNALEATDTSQLLGMVVAERALEDAGYGEDREFSREKVSVILGVTGTLELVIPLGARLGHPRWKKAMSDAGVDEAAAREVVERISDSYVEWQENSFPGLLGNVVAGRISKYLDLGGTNCVVDAACASSLSAIHLASLELKSGKADMVVSGGIDTFNDIFMYMCFSKTPALSPTGNAKPFDHESDGTILGEGLGVVVLKRLEDAERDGDRIYAVLKGIGSSSDGKGDAIYAPSAAGQQKALREAYENAGVSPGTIELLEAHGTGTKKGDAVEANALAEVYQKNGREPWCALGSVKSQIGHTKSSAGAAGIIKAAMALYDKVLPPTIKVERPQDVLAPGATPFYVNTAKRPWLPSGEYPRRAAVSSFGFGGSNFHCVLEEHNAVKTKTTWDGRVQIAAFSAAAKDGLRSLLPAWEENLAWENLRDFAARSRAVFDSTAAHRLVLVFEQGKSSPSKIVDAARERLADAGDTEWSTPDGAVYGSGSANGKLAVLFPGQGAQYTGMLRDLACQFPSMLDALDEANNALGEAFSGKRLHDFIYPHPTFDRESAKANQAALTSTDVAQPAIGAVSLGAFRVLQDFGLKAGAFAGHSYGELTALCAAGRMDADTFFRISALRGSLMAGGGEDRGGMAAVRAPLGAVESILDESGLDLVVANKNTSDQAVISGGAGEIIKAVELFKSRDIRCTKLEVGAAFHSPLVADASPPFLEGMQAFKFSESAIPVFANTTGEEYPGDPDEAKALLAGQLARPVEFVREIETMYARGVRVFVEVGPGARLSGLVRSILGDKEHAVCALDASNGKRDGIFDLAKLLAALAALGQAISLSQWDSDYRPVEANDGEKRFTVPICGANYVGPKKKKAAGPKAAVAAPKQAPADTPMAAVKASAPAPPRVPREMPRQPERATAPTPAPTPIQAPAFPAPSAPAMDPSTAVGLLAQAQANIAALQRMQEQTAALHKQYLEGQENAASAVRSLLQQQQGLFQQGSTPPAPLVVPAPQAVATEQPLSPIETPQEMPTEPVQPVAEEEARLAPPPVADEQLDLLRVGLLEVVAEKTGYPAEMLDPGMSLDGDLGIDSIKRVEILSALQERFPDLPTIEAEELGAIQTLADILEHLGGAVEPVAAAGDAAPADANYQGLLLDIVAEKTGYPVDMLELGMSLDGDLGIDSIKRVEILSALQERRPELPFIEAEDLGKLHTLRDVIAFISGGDTPPAAAKAISSNGKPESLEPGDSPRSVLRRSVPTCVPLGKAARGAVAIRPNAEIWVTDDGSEFSAAIAARFEELEFTPKLISMNKLPAKKPEKLDGLVIVAPEAPIGGAYLKEALALAQFAAPLLRQAGDSRQTLFATISRLDGSFGFGGSEAGRSPLSGGLAGLTKTASHEWPEMSCKALDVASDFKSVAKAASAAVDELLLSSPLEVGLSRTSRVTISLEEQALEPEGGAPRLSASDVVVVTGGARGVTAEVAVAMAKRYRCGLALMGRTELGGTEESYLDDVQSGAAIKKAVLDHAKQKLTPKELERICGGVLARREIAATLKRIEEAGGRGMYIAADIRNSDAVASAIGQASKKLGTVTALVHGAGVLADRRIEDKTAGQFDLVYDTKVTGMNNLLSALGDSPLKAIVLFSSSTARFGRTGQSDYAMANEVLNKTALAEAAQRENCRVLSMNWGPWDGGMVTPALKKIFEEEGAGVIGLEAGAEHLLDELDSPGQDAVEIVILADPPGGVSSKKPAASSEALAPVVELSLDTEAFPFLTSHVIDNKPVLPVSMYVEWFAHAALHGNPGMRFQGLNDLRVLKGVVLDGNGPMAIRVCAGRAATVEGGVAVPMEFRSVDAEGRDTLNAQANAFLVSRLEKGKAALSPIDRNGGIPEAAAIYNGNPLFHGVAFQGIREIEGCTDYGIAALVNPAPRPVEWIRDPLRKSWIADPLVLDASFQLMIVWSNATRGECSLPVAFRRYTQYQAAFPKGPVRIVANVIESGPDKAVADIEFYNANNGHLVAAIEGYECVIDAGLNEAFKRNRCAPSPTRR